MTHCLHGALISDAHHNGASAGIVFDHPHSKLITLGIREPENLSDHCGNDAMCSIFVGPVNLTGKVSQSMDSSVRNGSWITGKTPASDSIVC